MEKNDKTKRHETNKKKNYGEQPNNLLSIT